MTNTMDKKLTNDDVRAAGGIVHKDGNIFFKSVDVLNDYLAERASNPASPAPVAASDEKLWELIDAYASAKANYERSNARHMFETQRGYMEEAKADLRAALAAAPQAQAVPVAQWIRNNYQDHPNVDSLCTALVEAFATPPAAAAAPSEQEADTDRQKVAFNNGLKTAADICDAKFQARVASGHPREASAARALAEEIRSVVFAAAPSTAATEG